MRTVFILVLGMIIFSTCLNGQSDSITEINFHYDDAGNRIERGVIYYTGGLKSAKIVAEVDEKPEFEKGLNVYPNPASESLYVTLNDEALEEDQRTLYLFDNLGKLVLQKRNLTEINQIDVSSLTNGSYILKLTYGTKHKEWTIIKN